MVVGYHAPLPPARTGVADYAASLLEALRVYGHVVVDAVEADVHLYHLGNNGLHRPMWQRACKHPGVVLLHDACLHHFYLGTLDREAYIEEFCRQYGEWHRAFAATLWRQRALSAADERYFRYPMLRAVLDRARAVVVHNRAAARIVEEHGGKPHELPHLFQPPPEPALSEVLQLRARLGLAGHDFLFAVFGHLRESKRLPTVLRAFARARRQGPKIYLLLAGEFVSKPYGRAMAECPSADVLRTGYLTEADFWLHAHAADACVNLRYPSCGETSGIGVRLMGIGKPCLVTAGEEYAAYPETAVIRVDAGPAEQEHLEAWMGILAADRTLAQQIGERARRHVAEKHQTSAVARQLWELLRRSFS